MSAEDEDAALAELDQMIADADKVAEIPEEELVPQLPDVPSDQIPGVTVNIPIQTVEIHASDNFYFRGQEREGEEGWKGCPRGLMMRYWHVNIFNHFIFLLQLKQMRMDVPSV